MTNLIPGLSAVAARYHAVLCDLWGCLHNGVTPFPAAVAALRSYRQGGGRVILLTNAPRPRATVIAQLDRMGVPRDAWDDVVTSGDAAQAAMLAGAVGLRVHHIGAAKDEDFFIDLPEGAPVIDRVPLDQAEGLVVTGLRDDLTETPADYRATLLLAKTRGLPLLCANPDVIVDMGEKRLFCAGALAEAYEAIGGRALYFGKPHPPVYDLARRRLADMGAPDDSALLAIGDGILTDVKGAVLEGIDSLFITGGIAAGAFGPDQDRPDPSLLADWTKGQGFVPTHALPALR